ncbi:MAG: restriction endonuclease subunit S [Serratia marcescens]|uniref:restriction endonuclease subunit S n=1 Tax=Serratia sp. JKS296 TaxID=1938824 RepID=UPI000BC7041E|nr:restriction endonuclease subunit S [Serratia sp. JKS296]MDU3572498.1 restriction endonuclease subunit S [Serratia marcescens]MDU3649569.1 restriction endonuclease subunit S [Serratia marcescens]SOD35577.1 type I restriction enzyme, S subunit [Serratia sp. JKS296]
MSNWKKTTLGQVAQVFTGFPFKSSGYSDDPKDIKLLRGDNIAQGTLRWDDAKRWPKNEYEKYNQYQLKENDVVLAMDRPWIGAGLKYSSIRKEDLPSLLVQRTARLRGSTELDIIYLKYIIASPWFSKYIQSINTGSLVPHISSKQIKDFPINLPPLPQQKKLSSVLAALDKKIDVNNFINAELEAMAKTLYDYWFVQFDFPDANGKPYKTSGGKMVYNATLKREVPVGWAVNTLSQIANITMGQSPAGESYNEDGIGTLFFQGSTDFGWLFPTPRQYTTSPARMAKKGDILLSVRAPVGDMNIANADCCIGRGLAALNSKSHSDGFLFYVMKYFKQIFDRRNAEGTTFGSMTKDDLHSLQVVCPEPGLLKRYDDIVSEYNKMIFSRSLENQNLIKLRDWLLPLLMNGQVTVK